MTRSTWVWGLKKKIQVTSLPGDELKEHQAQVCYNLREEMYEELNARFLDVILRCRSLSKRGLSLRQGNALKKSIQQNLIVNLIIPLQN